ncbi:MAG: hypothetical protein ABFQ62_01575 [Patescibacteria group bacterium]
MPTVRLTINNQLENTFSNLEKVYKPMSRSEILKMALAELERKIIVKNAYPKTDRSGSLLTLADADIFELNDESQDIYTEADGKPFKK